VWNTVEGKKDKKRKFIPVYYVEGKKEDGFLTVLSRMQEGGFIPVYYVEGKKEDLYQCVEYYRRKEVGWLFYCVK
jgi:hypothetical protein